MTEVKAKTGFGPEQLTNPTPKWAKIVFGIFITLTTAVGIWVAGTALIAEAAKMEWLLILKCADLIIFGISKLFGVEQPDAPSQNFR